MVDVNTPNGSVFESALNGQERRERERLVGWDNRELISGYFSKKKREAEEGFENVL